MGRKGEGWGERGREVGVRVEGSGECLPACPPLHMISVFVKYPFFVGGCQTATIFNINISTIN